MILLNSKVKVSFFVVLLLLSSISAFGLTNATSPKKRYTKSEIVLSGLSQPSIVAMDRRGRIYFTETYQWDDGETWILERYNPRTGRIEQLASHNYFIPHVCIDAKGNIYYVVGGNLEEVSEIYKLKRGASTSTMLYKAEGFDILSMDVDMAGNVYFSIGNFHGDDPSMSNTSKLMMIPRNDKRAIELVSFTSPDSPTRICNIQAGKAKRFGVYFTAELSDGYYIYRFIDGDLESILCKPKENSGYIAYITLSRSGSLYYLYRQRSIDPLWGYLEIGRFRRVFTHKMAGPEILFRQKLEEAIFCWFPPDDYFFSVSSTGDVFSVIIFFDGEKYINELTWLNVRTSQYKTLASSEQPREYMNFVLDRRGNIYYSMSISGNIVKINR